MVALKAETLPPVTFADLDQLIPSDITKRIPFILHGSPGIGKSAYLDALANKLNMKPVVFSAPEREATDASGIMYIDRSGETPLTRWAPVSWPIELQNVLFIIEEISRGEKPTKNQLLRTFNERYLGETKIPDSWAVCGASNPFGIGTSATSEALSSRVQNYYVVSNPEDWDKSYAKANKVNNMVRAFIKGYGRDIFDLYEAGALTFPCARQWVKVSDAVYEFDPNFPNNERLMVAKLSGLVGEAAAIRFVGYWKQWKQLADPQVVFMNPTGANLPTEPSAKFAVASALAMQANDPTRFERFAIYMSRLDKEFEYMFVRDAIDHNPALQVEQCFANWNQTNEKFLLNQD